MVGKIVTHDTVVNAGGAMASISAPQVVSRGRVLSPGRVEFHRGRITDVGESDEADVELTEGVLVPGLVDLQVNGFFGVDFIDATPADWDMIARRLPSTGVTAFVPTIITAPVQVLADGLRRAEAAIASQGPEDARILGVHVEGPFISERRKGAHDAALLCDPDENAIETLLDAAPGTLAILTLAPERAGALDAIGRLTRSGVLVSVGHSDATADVVAAASAAGARMVTHLFNAQRPLHHREPGVSGHALVDPLLTCGLIADNHHVVPEVCRLAFNAAPGRIALVTDAAASAGMPPGRYQLGGQPVTMAQGQPPLRDDGTIAGSALRLDEAVANVVAAGVDLVAAVDAATRVPADLIGRDDLGRLEPGARADIVWLGDDLRTRATWIGGEMT
jgi:N-acetylglucosamine-6-phosphate deacetylase